MQINLYNKISLLSLFILIGFGTMNAQRLESWERSKTNINSDWNYLENDAKNISEIANAGN